MIFWAIKSKKKITQMLKKQEKWKLLNTLSLVKNSLWEFSNFAEFTQTVEKPKLRNWAKCGIKIFVEFSLKRWILENGKHKKIGIIKWKKHFGQHLV